MSRGTTLANLRTMLKAEIGDYSGTNSTRDAELNVLLATKQKVLGTEHDWPFLHQQWDVVVSAGTKFVAVPTSTATAANPASQTVDVDLDKLPTLWVYYNGTYQPVIYGVQPDEYNVFDFTNDASRSDPIQRWRYATNVNESNLPNRFEVWPVPATEQKLRFIGKRALTTLTSDSHTADLDDVLIVLFTAADILARKKSQDAQLKLQQANRRLQWLRQGYNVKDVKRTMDGQSEGDRVKLVGIRVAVA